MFTREQRRDIHLLRLYGIRLNPARTLWPKTVCLCYKALEDGLNRGRWYIQAAQLMANRGLHTFNFTTKTPPLSLAAC